MTTDHARNNDAAQHVNPEHSGMRTGNPQMKDERKQGKAREGSADAHDKAGDRPGNAGPGNTGTAAKRHPAGR